MSELRWTLLILGVVFIAALSWWERRRPRQAFAPHLRDASLSHGDARRVASIQPGASGEPWIGEEGLSDVVSSVMALSDAAEAREPGDGDEHVEPTVRGPLEELPTVVIGDAEDRIELETAWDDLPPEPKLIDPELTDPEASATGELPELAAAMDPSEPLESAAMAMPATPPAAGPAEPAVAVIGEPEITGAEGVSAVRMVEPAAHEGGAPPAEVVVEWPPEESRRILALRIVAPHAERFAGRTLRLALAAEGFLLGRFAIFHKPDETNHALLSAASLNRPGSFDLETMDSQRYGGLTLFAVLPGRRTPQAVFEDLLAAARNLNERLEGGLQDERGAPLTALRVQSIRESLRVEVTTLPPAAAHGA
ncbi:MAG: cell division protein ZipA C-terminal FtsZ-binding domain-containing protein [Steroidobacteraceae bacterium]